MPKKKKALEGCRQRPLSPARHISVLSKNIGVARPKSPRKKAAKHVRRGIEDRFIEDLIVYPTGKGPSSQQAQRQVSQAAIAVEPPEAPRQPLATQRQTVSCVVYLKLLKAGKPTLEWKLSLLRAVLNFIKREIPQAREKDVLAPSFVSISSPEERK